MELKPWLIIVLSSFVIGCSSADKAKPAAVPAPAPVAQATPAPADKTPTKQAGSSLPQGLILAYSQFVVEDGKPTAKPGPALLELLTLQGEQWVAESIKDPTSNVFHKAMPLRSRGELLGLLTIGAMDAHVKLWTRNDGVFRARSLWSERFGGKFNRMRDVEAADLYGDGSTALAVATHDQGVVGILREKNGSWSVNRIDRKKDTFVHEIEIGDLDGDGVLEVYATPSDPNKLDAESQHGKVVRYVPAKDAERSVVADLGERHAKEILVDDVDGDGRDELYVAVEALTTGSGADLQLVEPVEIRRYDADSAVSSKTVIATIPDRLCRFLTAGDVDGDGKKEMVAAAFSSGLWLLRPGKNPRGEWGIERIDGDSGGFEHAALLTDLDGDGRDELYVAADTQGELRRYVWKNGRAKRETIRKREIPMSRITWNIQAFPTSMLD